MEENRTTAGKMPLRNAVCCFLGALIWGTAFVAQRIGSDEIPVSAFVGIRFLMGFVVLLPLVIARERMRRRRIAQGDRTVEPVDHRQSVIGGMVCGVVLMAASWLQQAAIPHVSVGKAGFLTALYIIMVPILSFNLLLSIVLSCSINMIEFFDRPFPSASMATCVGRSALFFFDVIAATMMVGLYLFPTSFCTTRTGRTPPCSEPVTGLRSAK